MTAVRISAREREVATQALRAIIEMYKQPARTENELLDMIFGMHGVAKSALEALGEGK